MRARPEEPKPKDVEEPEDEFDQSGPPLRLYGEVPQISESLSLAEW